VYAFLLARFKYLEKVGHRINRQSQHQKRNGIREAIASRRREAIASRRRETIANSRMEAIAIRRRETMRRGAIASRRREAIAEVVGKPGNLPPDRMNLE
jgi:hypothetical protein